MSAPSIDISGINKRFFEALDILEKDKSISGISAFCIDNGLNRNKYYSIKNNNGHYKNIDLEAIYILASKYNFSLDWLFFGLGEKRTAKSSKFCNPTTITIDRVKFFS